MTEASILTTVVASLVVAIVLMNRNDLAKHRDYMHQRLGELQSTMTELIMAIGRLEGRLQERADKDKS